MEESPRDCYRHGLGGLNMGWEGRGGRREAAVREIGGDG